MSPIAKPTCRKKIYFRQNIQTVVITLKNVKFGMDRSRGKTRDP